MLQASVIVLESLSLHWASKHVSPRGFNCWFSFTWNWSSKPRRRACGGSWSSCAWVLISRRTISCIYPTTSSQSHVSWWKVAGFCQGFAVPRHFDFAPSLLIPSTSIWAEMKGVASCRCPGAGPALENLLNHYEQQGVLSQIQQKCLEVVWADGGIGVALGEVDLFWYDLVELEICRWTAASISAHGLIMTDQMECQVLHERSAGEKVPPQTIAEPCLSAHAGAGAGRFLFCFFVLFVFLGSLSQINIYAFVYIYILYTLHAYCIRFWDGFLDFPLGRSFFMKWKGQGRERFFIYIVNRYR